MGDVGVLQREVVVKQKRRCVEVQEESSEEFYTTYELFQDLCICDLCICDLCICDGWYRGGCLYHEITNFPDTNAQILRIGALVYLCIFDI